jgi:predicted PurR-regulated permease PerM
MIETIKALPGWLRLWVLFPLAFLNGWLLLQLLDYLSPFIGVFVAAAIFAFLLDLPTQFLVKRAGIPRGWAIAIVILTALLIVTGVSLTIGPLALDQLKTLITNLPQLLDSSQRQLELLRQYAIAQNLPLDLTNLLNQAINQLTGVFQLASNRLLAILTETINSVVNVLFFIVLTIFMVVGGEEAWDGIFSWLPAPWNETLQESVQSTFRRYFGIQVILAGVLSIAQTLGLLVWGVPYAILFGVTIGAATLIPYGGALATILISSIVALQDFVKGIEVLITAIVIGQINDIFISPRLMGETIGLNPIWLIAALFLGGKVGGVLGLIIAVPIASVIKSTADRLRQIQDP